MRFTRVSPITGQTHVRDIQGVTVEQIMKWHEGALIQEAFPNLTNSDREFIQTGITDEEWKTYVERK